MKTHSDHDTVRVCYRTPMPADIPINSKYGIPATLSSQQIMQVDLVT